MQFGMKISKIKTLRVALVFLLFIFNQASFSYATSIPDPTQNIPKNNPKIRIIHAAEAEYKFYKGDYDGAAFIFETLTQKKDRHYALWSNQLGSIYLTKGEYEKAQDAFLKAYYLMNDISAFHNLESSAVSLMGSEAKKAYKGDPYEKVFNSLYTALLLYRKGDLENALAACKNGILCDSDTKGNLYQSDSFMLYLLASRILLLQGDESSSKEYFNKAIDAYYLSFSTNRLDISKEQAQRYLLIEKEKELDELENSKKKAKGHKKTLNKIRDIKIEIEKIDNNIKTLHDKRKKNNLSIDVSMLNDFVNLKNNTLFCIELGRGPLKYPIGRYGELGVFTYKPSGIKKIGLFIDGKKLGEDKFTLNSDTFFQAITRGGREMDGILKGQAEFKQTTADMSLTFNRVSQNMINNANQQVRANPYYDASGTYAAAAIMSAIGICMALASVASNPAADVRHWSLMPGSIILIPCNLKQGSHDIKIDCYDYDDQLLGNLDSTVDIKEEKNNIIFKRFL